MNKSRAAYGLLSPLLLLAGACLYLAFRDVSSLLLFAWIPNPGFADGAAAQPGPSFFANAAMFNLAGALWLVSGILFFRFVWFRRPRLQRAYIACFCGAAAAFEIGQLSEKVPGTFDALDLLFMGIGAFAEGLLYNIFAKRRTA